MMIDDRTETQPSPRCRSSTGPRLPFVGPGSDRPVRPARSRAIERPPVGAQGRLHARRGTSPAALVGDEAVGAGFLHQVLHLAIHRGALFRVRLAQRLLVQLVELGVREALPVPDADLVAW